MEAIKPRYMTVEEKSTIIDMYDNGFNTVQISHSIGRNQTTVERYLKKNGYTKFGKERLGEKELSLIKRLYLSNKMNAQEIWEQEFKNRFSKGYIERAIREMGISRGQGRGLYNKTLNHNYFDDIDDEHKAYILGYIYADGGIANHKTLRLECTSNDVEILVYIGNQLNLNDRIRRYSREGRNETSVLYISSIDIVNSLSRFGVVKNKQSLDILIPNLREDLIRHFIRGYFDGDGSITYAKSSSGKFYPRISICLTKGFGKQLESILKNSNVISSKDSCNLIDMKKYGSNIFNLRISRINDIMRFYEYIYDNSMFSLSRKREKMNNLLKPFSYANTEVTRASSSTVTHRG